MMSNLPKGWAETTMDKLVELAQGVAINAKTNHVLCEKLEGLPLLKINNLLNNTIDQYANPKLVPQKAILKRDDIIFTRTGQVGWVFTNKIGILHNNSFKVIPSEKLNKKFLYWFLKQKSIYSYVQKVAAGSAQPDLNHGAFKTISIKYPTDLDEQKQIANILSSFDKKIELLKEQNQTLETMAQTIFKEWFVKNTKEEWKKKPLSYFGNIICGKTPSKGNSEYFAGNVPFIKIPDMHGNVFILKTIDTLSKIGKESQKNKTLPSKSICVSCIATVGLVSMNIVESQTNQQINSIVPHKDFYRYFIFFCMQLSYNLLHAMASGGTATLNLNTGHFSKIEVLKPDDETLKRFHEIAELIFDKILINSEQIQTLEEIRDSLLPKLMSGKIRLKDFDE